MLFVKDQYCYYLEENKYHGFHLISYCNIVTKLGLEMGASACEGLILHHLQSADEHFMVYHYNIIQFYRRTHSVGYSNEIRR
jgi:hypothetical protein